MENQQIPMSFSPIQSLQESLQNSPQSKNNKSKLEADQQSYELLQFSTKDALQGASFRKLLFATKSIQAPQYGQNQYEDIPEIDSMEGSNNSNINNNIQNQKPPDRINNYHNSNSNNYNEEIHSGNIRKSSNLRSVHSHKRISQTTAQRQIVNNAPNKQTSILQNGQKRNNQNPKQVWAKKVLYIIATVNKFVFYVKKIILFRRPHLLNPIQLQAINDLASQEVSDGWGIKNHSVSQILERERYLRSVFGKYVKQYKIYKKKLKQLCSCCVGQRLQYLQQKWKQMSQSIDAFFAKKVPVINQESRFSIIWHVIIVALTILYLFYIPLEFSFEMDHSSMSYVWLHVILPIIFLIDVLVQADTSYFEKDQPIIDHKEIISNYFKKRFIWDILTIFSIIQEDRGIGMIFMVRLFHMQSTIQKLKENLTLSNEMTALVHTCILVIRLCFMCHIISCLWFLVGRVEREQYNDGWLVFESRNQQQARIKPSNQTVQQNYILSLYIIVLSLTFSNGQTINSGQVDTDFEKVFRVLIALLSLFLLPYMILQVKEIYEKLRMKTKQYNKKLQEFNTYLDSHEVDPFLKRRALKYLENQYKEGLDRVKSMEQNLNCLSKYLREEIQTEVNMKTLKKISLLSHNFTEKFLQRLSLKTTEHVYGPDELILLQNSVEQPSLYIMKHGEVELFIQIGQGRNKQRVVSLKKLRIPYSMFGELEFFSQQYKALFSVRTTCETCICRIDLSTFLDLLHDFPEDREMFCFLRDKLVLDKDYSKVWHNCFACQRQASHNALECPFIFYGKIKKYVIDKMNKEINETIKNFRRSTKRKKFQSIKNSQHLQEKSLAFADEYEDIIQEYYGDLDEDSSSLSSSSDNALQYLENEEGKEQLQPEVEEGTDPLQKKIELEMKKNLKRVPSITSISSHHIKADQLQPQQIQQQQQSTKRPISQQIIPENQNSQLHSLSESNIKNFQFFSERLLPNENNGSVSNQTSNNKSFGARSEKRHNTSQAGDQAQQSSQVQSVHSSIVNSSQMNDPEDFLDDEYQRTHRISDSLKNQSMQDNNDLNTSENQYDKMPSLSSHNRQNSRNLSNVSKHSSKGGRSHSYKTPQELQNLAGFMGSDLNLNNEKMEQLIKNSQTMLYNRIRGMKSPTQNMMFDFECEDDMSMPNNAVFNFKHYFPENNVSNVIDKYNSKVKKGITKFKSKTRFSQKKVKSSGKFKATPIQSYQKDQDFVLNQ